MRMSCSAWRRASGVSFWPDSMRATSCTRACGVQFLHRRHRAALDLVLFHLIVMVGEAGDLRQVRHAQHLAGGGQPLQPAADTLRRAAADAGIHFVEDQRAAVLALRQARLQRQRDARDLAARRDLLERRAAPRPGSGRPGTPRGPRLSPTTPPAPPRCGTRCAPWPAWPVRLPPSSPACARPACAGRSRAAACAS